MEPYFDLNFNLTQNTQFQLSPVNSVTDEMLLNLEESTFLCEDDKFLCKTDTEKAIGDERFVCATNAEINQIKANRYCLHFHKKPLQKFIYLIKYFNFIRILRILLIRMLY